MSAKQNAPHLADPDTNPSFTRGVFQGEIREDIVFPFPQPSKEEKESLAAILDAFRSWAADTLDSAKLDHDGKFPDEVRKGMADLGLMGLNIPEQYGGFGASSMVFTRVFGEIGAHDAALAVYFGAHGSIGIKGIILFGTDDQKQRWLPRCASGELVGAFCLTEPGSGSDAQAMLTTAVPSADGSHYVLNGTKFWISNAGYAGVLTVFAKVPVTIDGKLKQRVTAFIVDAKAPGISLGKIEEKMGIKASDTRAVIFENVKVPKEDLLGELGHGFNLALEVLNSGRLGLAAGSSRGTRVMMAHAIAYAKQREQFGKPIGSFEMIQKKIASAAADCYAADAGWMLCAGMVDRGGIDFSLETAACKIYASELAFRTASEAMQIAGGIGYSKEFPYERALRDSRINMIFEGTNEILRMFIALNGMQGPGESLKALAKHKSVGALGEFAARRLRRVVSRERIEKVAPALEHESDLVTEAAADLAKQVEGALIKHGRGILDREYVQSRIANAAIDLYAMSACIARATSAVSKQGEDGAKRELLLTKTFCAEARRRVRRELRAVHENHDESFEAIVDQVRAARDYPAGLY